MRSLAAFLLLLPTPLFAAERTLKADLLVVGGTEAGVASCVQAARSGVRNIILVNDIEWLGGQFSAEAVGAIDEWTTYQGKRIEFSRSGTFLEVLRLIREHNKAKYGLARPGNGFCASETIEPAAAAVIFEQWVAPHTERGSKSLQIIRSYQPVAVKVVANRVASVTFESVNNPKDLITIEAAMTIDASDWGDVIRLSGAKWAAGPDLKSRFNEPNAPTGPLLDDRNEMNPLSWCMVLREVVGEAKPVNLEDFDERTFFGTTGLTTAEFAKVGWPKGAQQMRAAPFVDTDYPEGIYSALNSIYTHRRLVDRRHNNLPKGSEAVLVNWPTQDYPLYDFPKMVADALEETEKGASKKNIVAMTYVQRRIVFEDAKRHTLGMLQHLQSTVHERLPKGSVSFRDMELSTEFGTPDRLPPKPYVREGLRLEALYMLREGDIRMRGKEPGWAKHMVPDSVFGFQFNIDFHPTRRVFLNADRSGPWANVHTENRNWSTHTDRACFSLRSLVPTEINGLIGASKNIGVSSIVSSAVRLHGQMMLGGQAAGALAASCLKNERQPRELVRDLQRVRELQLSLVRAGVLLWPYQDLTPDDICFEAANMLAVRAIFVPDDSVDFQPWKPVNKGEVQRTITHAGRSLVEAKEGIFTDVSREKDLSTIATWKLLHEEMTRLGWKPSEGLARKGDLPLTRSELVRHVWSAIKDRPEWFPETKRYLGPGNDADGDGIPDREDALPFDKNNDSVPDRLEVRVK
ncbi:MAG: FAD-dependent oxidoreductase [Planctomycetes bacterium]|nr:FAD-dependent oxidoreductase [Planctomycetota bacterium]